MESRRRSVCQSPAGSSSHSKRGMRASWRRIWRGSRGSRSSSTMLRRRRTRRVSGPKALWRGGPGRKVAAGTGVPGGGSAGAGGGGGGGRGRVEARRAGEEGSGGYRVAGRRIGVAGGGEGGQTGESGCLTGAEQGGGALVLLGLVFRRRGGVADVFIGQTDDGVGAGLLADGPTDGGSGLHRDSHYTKRTQLRPGDRHHGGVDAG